MANEYQIRCSLRVLNPAQNINYQNRPASFQADMGGSAGPTPGDVLIGTTPTAINFSALTAPGGPCRIINRSATVWVEYGIFDTADNKFRPLGEVGPGEEYVIRLSRYLGSDFGTGSGTGPASSGGTLRFKGIDGTARVTIDAFDK